jgi:hypothetical protein
MPRTKQRGPRVADVPAKARGLLALPNVGPATALDLVHLGIFELEALKKQRANAMYARLCKIDGIRHDPCVIDVFASLVAHANGAPARPWWFYTPERKKRASRPPK